MPGQIRPAESDRLPDFAAEVSRFGLSRPASADHIAAVVAGMDRYAVLVFRNLRLDDGQQLAFSRNFEPLMQTTGDIRSREERGLSYQFEDISNLGRNNEVLARDDRRRLFSLGNMLWHSDSSFKPTPAKYSLLHARILPQKGGNTEFADMRAAHDAIDAENESTVPRACLHAQPSLFARHSRLDEWNEEELARNRPCRSA